MGFDNRYDLFKVLNLIVPGIIVSNRINRIIISYKKISRSKNQFLLNRRRGFLVMVMELLHFLNRTYGYRDHQKKFENYSTIITC